MLYAPKQWLVEFTEWVALIAVSEHSMVTSFKSIAYQQTLLNKWQKLQTTGLEQIKPIIEPLTKACAEFAFGTAAKLNDCREQFYQQLGSSEYTTQRISQFNQLVYQLLPLLGPAPCSLQVIGIGSLGKGRLLPYSDFDIAILIEDAKFRSHPWLKAYVNLLDTVTRILDNQWYWHGNANQRLGSLQVTGHHIDPGDIKYLIGKEPELVNTPDGLAKWLVASLDNEAPKYAQQRMLAYSLLHISPLTAVKAANEPIQLYHAFYRQKSALLRKRVTIKDKNKKNKQTEYPHYQVIAAKANALAYI